MVGRTVSAPELERLERMIAGAACEACGEPCELLATAWHHRDEPATPHEVASDRVAAAVSTTTELERPLCECHGGPMGRGPTGDGARVDLCCRAARGRPPVGARRPRASVRDHAGGPRPTPIASAPTDRAWREANRERKRDGVPAVRWRPTANGATLNERRHGARPTAERARAQRLHVNGRGERNPEAVR